MGCGESKHAIATENTLTKSKSKGKSVETNNTTTTPLLENATIDDNANVKENQVQETGDENVKENQVQETGDQNVKENQVQKTGDENVKENRVPKTGDENVKENQVQKTGEENVKKDEIPVDAINKEEKKEPLPEKTENILEIGNENIKKIDENNDGKLEAVAVVGESKTEGIVGEKKDDTEEVDQEEKEKMISHDCPKNDDALVANSDNEKEEDVKVDEGKEVVADAADETESSVDEKVPAAEDENVNDESSTTEVKAN